MTIEELRRNRQITNVKNFHDSFYEVYDEETIAVIYYSKESIEYYKSFIPNPFYFGGHIGLNKDGKFEICLDRYVYQSHSLEELEEKLHQYNIEEGVYN